MVMLLILIGAAVSLIGGVLSIRYMQAQQHKEWDTDIDKKVLRHPFRSNAGIIMYLLFPILMIVGAFFLGLYYRWWTGE